VFFGREEEIADALDRLARLRESAPPRLMAILGASGIGKSSLLRAGVLPRLMRDELHYSPLPTLRPGNSAITGEAGLVRSLERACSMVQLNLSRSELLSAIEDGSTAVKSVLNRLTTESMSPCMDEMGSTRPTLVLPIDQAEELWAHGVNSEAQTLLELLRELLQEDNPALIGIVTVRSASMELFEHCRELGNVQKELIYLNPMQPWDYANVIRGPALRDGLSIEDALVDALLEDTQGDGALSLLAFTLRQLYENYSAERQLSAKHYRQIGRHTIEQMLAHALTSVAHYSGIPQENTERLDLLRRCFIPCLVSIDAETPWRARARRAYLSEFPDELLPLLDRLVDHRILTTDREKDTGAVTIGIAHEAILHYWEPLQTWVREYGHLLIPVEELRRASRIWVSKNKKPAWLVHRGARLEECLHYTRRRDIASWFDPVSLSYVEACASLNARGAYPPPSPKGTKIFISYRREDTRHVAGRIFDYLKKEFSEQELFFDVESIPIGADFRMHINTRLEESAAVLAIVGPLWINRDWNWNKWLRRAPAKEDYVLLEIETALKLGVPVIPIRVDETAMPPVHRLPPSIRDLTDRNWTPIRDGRDFPIDMGRLVEVLQKLREQGK
jgi:hypothetical protein